MRANKRDNVTGKIHEEIYDLEEIADNYYLGNDTEVEGTVDDFNMNTAKTFKHLRKDDETEF